ncbi:MAG: hypothetical protein J6J66_02530 [Clostridia bacterium]|nr:hypothetical protein [Clostridia bacterium]
MKRIKDRKKIRKVTVATLVIAMLLCVSMAVFAPVASASDVPTPANVEGKFHLGTAGILDPVKVETGEGYYMNPSSYVYFGEVYNPVTRTYETVLCRVLDADRDITGAEGAMLLYTESAIEPARFYVGSASAAAVVGTENIYAISRLRENESQKLYFRSHYGRHFEGVPEEEDFLRRVTKTDVKADMVGLFENFLTSIDPSLYPALEDTDYTFSFETDTVNAENSYRADRSDSVLALDHATFFALSADEFHKYMGSLSSSGGYASKDILTGQSTSYWLRTGIYEQLSDRVEGADYFDYVEQQLQGNLVLGVDAAGKLVALPAESEGVYGRFAFHLNTESIVYTHLIDGAHKLAFADPRYAEGEADPFKAEIVGTDKDGIVTVRYTNAIRSRSTVWYGEDESEHISVIIKDSEGNVKSYAPIAEVPQCYYEKDEEKKSSEAFTAHFRLPEDYDEANDTIVIFWERLHEDTRKPSFVSNMVELTCAHTYYGEDESTAVLPTCSALGTCAKCGEQFGDTDPTRHPNMESGDYAYDDLAAEHWHICPDCGAAGEREACSFINYCIAPCVCGNIDEDSEGHNFGYDGVCTREGCPSPYEKPEMSVSGDYYITVRIGNEGNFLWLAEQIRAGKKQYVIWETYYVYLDADLDFNGMDFVPLGTQENPFKGEINSLGRDYTIKNISYSDPDATGVGIIGWGENVKIVDICLQDVSFEGKDAVGGLVGEAKNADVTGVTVIGEVSTVAADGAAGLFFGRCDSASSVSVSFAYTEDAHGAPTYAPAFGEGAPAIDTAFFLAEEDGEGGYISAETFASGMVAYRFRQKLPTSGWRQTLTWDAYPRRDGSGAYVRITEYCDGTPAIYTNNPKDEMIHEPAELYGFEWRYSYSYCEADVLCGRCNQRMMTPAFVQITNEYPRSTHIAQIMVGGTLMESEPVVIFGVTLEEFIGMSALTLTYNGRGIYPDVMLTNIALHESEYDAYFVNSDTGEAYFNEGYYGDPEAYPITDVGVYDLVIVGKLGNSWEEVGGNWNEENSVTRGPRNFSGQSVTYERVLTVLPAEVTLTPMDVYKHYDGNAAFIPHYTVDSEDFGPWSFNVYLSDSPSAAVGDYTLTVTADTAEHGDNVILTLAKSSVCGSIVEARSVTVENKDYPTVFVYGDPIPTPTAADFLMTEGAAFSYKWFAVKSADGADQAKLLPVDGTPRDAGSYVLRAYASGTDTLGGSYTDVAIEIRPATVYISYVMPAYAETVVDVYTEYVFLDSLDDIEIRFSGFVNGENADSLGITARAVGSKANLTIKSAPERKNVYLGFEILGDAKNYRFVEAEGEDETVISLAGIGLPEVIAEAYGYDWNENYTEEIWGFRYGFTWQQPTVDGFALDIGAGEHWRFFLTVYDISYGIESKTLTEIQNVQLGYTNWVTEYYHTVRTQKAGSYLLSLQARAYNYYGSPIELPGDADGMIPIEYYITISIEERSDGLVDKIGGAGCYTVTLDAFSSLAAYESGTADKTTSHEFFVTKEITMNFKEIEYNLLDETFNFDIEDIYRYVVMEAGGVFYLGHTLADVTVKVNANIGYAYVTGFKVVDKNGNDVSYLYSVKNSNGDTDHLGKGLGTAHIFDTACDPDCNVDGCTYRRSVSHMGDRGGNGNCLVGYVCEICDGIYMPENARHLSDVLLVKRCGEDITLHELVHACCGVTARTEAHASRTPATCRTLAVCDGCGRTFGALDPNNHEAEASYVSLGAEGHAVSYACCGKSYNEAHAGGAATCKTLAACESCGAGYGALDPDNHEGSFTVSVDPDNREMHIKVYTCCEESLSEAHAGGTATCKESAVCTVCSAKYGSLDPHNHASASVYAEVREDNASMHDAFHACCNAYIGKVYHSGGTASCMGGAICEACGADYGDADLTHHASEEFIFLPDAIDTSVHIKAYACCGEAVERVAHSLSGASCKSGATCAACGYTDGVLSAHTYENDCTAICAVCEKATRAESFHADKNGDGACDLCGAEVEKKRISGGGVSAIVTGSTVVAGAGGFSLFWFVIKKKSLAQLLMLLK